ncbi:MAG: hypothetical protein R2909_15840 [Gemmatimonadales bacterium]
MRSVTVEPAILGLDRGGQGTLRAIVVADQGASTAVVWRSSAPDVIAVTAAGVVTRALCGPSAVAHVEAIAVADSGKRGAAQVGSFASTPFPVIQRLDDSTTGAPVDLAAVRGTARVTIPSNLPASCPWPVDSIGLLVHSETIDTMLAWQATPQDGGRPVQLFWATAASSHGRTLFPNGNYAIIAVARVAGAAASLAGSALPLVLANP